MIDYFDAINIIGWIGAIAMGICAVPQAILSLKQKHSVGVSRYSYGIWFIGCIMMPIYITLDKGFDIIIISQYSADIASILTVLYYSYFPKVKNEV